MSYVLHILLALATLALADLGWVAPGEKPWAIAALVLVPYLLAACARRALLAGHFRWGAVFERLLAASPVVLQAVAIGALGWLETVGRFGLAGAPLEEWLGLGLLGALVPYLLYQLGAIDARARALAFPPDTAGKLRSFQGRMFLSALLPFLAYLAGASLIARSPTLRVWIEEVGLVSALVTAALLVLFLQTMPYFLRFVWDTTPLERGWARATLEKTARAAGFRYRELLQWNTGRQMSNAAIVGFSARTRHVFFSDLLLQQLGPSELAAVFAHEMGHARRAHALVFGAFALGFFLAVGSIVQHVGVEDPLQAAGVLVGVGALWYLSFGYLSRRFELEADLESLRIVGESGPLVRALELVTGAHAHERSSWRHFSTRDRVAFLTAAEHDPLVGLRLKLGLERWRRFGFLLLAATCLWRTWDLAGDWNGDWVRADLRLGRFEEAADRIGSYGVEPELGALARRSLEAPGDHREVIDLYRAALIGWRRGDRTAAREWLELARMRGGREVEPVLLALEDPGATTQTLARAWRQVARAFEDTDPVAPIRPSKKE